MSVLISLRTTLVALSIWALCLATFLVAQSRTANKSLPNQLIGSWKLVSLEEPGAGGAVRPVDCAGMFVFSDNGKAAVQIMYRDSKVGNDYALGGYEASYGSYQIEDAHTFTFHIEGSLLRPLIGKDLRRRYEISGKQLTITSTDPKEHWKVLWERF